MLNFQLFSAEITISPGASAKLVSKTLKNKGVINNSHLFYLYLRANKLTSKIHVGQFYIEPNTKFKDIADIITGKKQQLIPITIPEGYTISEIIHALEKKRIISNSESFARYLTQKMKSPINSLIQPNSISSMEGLLFPDTYFFSKNMSFDQIYSAFTKRFNHVFLPLYRNTPNPKLSFYDTLILASIIEKEAGTVAEMPLISGVFHNRLVKKMYLASCPTVGYAMGQPRKKSLTYKDLDYVSPFNTYRNKGLPPSPIAAPGKQAFLAALNPMKTPYLYFVSKNDGSGTHVFSKTLAAHLKHQKRILTQTK
ncbi:MAG: endolytic transglycosylase MltG [Candidatus Margulisiibacteriota bacterium]